MCPWRPKKYVLKWAAPWFTPGRAVVMATGMETEMGTIAGSLAKAEDDETPLQKRLNRLSRI
jgi:Ca2+-transporting ATPase